MTGRALIVCHSAHEGPGRVGSRLAERGFRVETFVIVDDPLEPVSHRSFPAVDDYAVIAAMGAPWSVYDTATIGSWIDRELDFLRTAHESSVPVLGVCFGAQALAAALGGSVLKSDQLEIGWHTIATHSDWIDSGPWFQWHGDRFTPPPQAEVLAESPVGPQAFTIGRSCGVQFHPEVDRRILDDWLAGVSARDGDFAAAGADPVDILARADTMLAHSLPAADRLVDGFLQRTPR
jgi:GMP synthase-like glutamine amidotransferase